MRTCKSILLALTISVGFLTYALRAQQLADPNFDASVEHPAYTKRHPRILFDEAHNNFHTATGRYKPFVDLITNDGYTVTPNKQPFEKKVLEGYDILVIANALGAARQNLPEAGHPAFTANECDVVRDWVRSGGALLLIADHAPFGAAAEIMGQRFGVDMSKGHTSDPGNFDPVTGNMSFIVYSRTKKLIVDHPITKGRNTSEQVNRVIAFTGQSLKGPAGSAAFLQLADGALDVTRGEGAAADSRPMDRLPDGSPLPPGTRVNSSSGRNAVSAAGRAQGLSFKFGKGRVVALGEAAMLSAQVVRGPVAQMLGREELQMGMNYKGIDNRQLALNIVHWLSRLLK